MGCRTATKPRKAGEWHHKAKDGHLFPVKINANYLEYDGQGYNLAMVRDSSKRKLAMDEFHKLNNELEQRVRKRTVEREKKNVELQKNEQILCRLGTSNGGTEGTD
jgi:hypothetical protein